MNILGQTVVALTDIQTNDLSNISQKVYGVSLPVRQFSRLVI
jgi:hypothetical protein